MKKNLISLFLALALVLCLAPAARALNVNIASGTCGDGLSWSLDGYTLTISGSGEITEAPWTEHKNHIEDVVLTGGVTKICDEAFSGFDRIHTVDFGDALVEIGRRAFYDCDKIQYIHLPATFRTFGAESFRGCTSLKYVYCEGGMPRFNDSCLWTGGYVSVFYPGSNPWPQESVNQLVSSFGGRMGVFMGSFDESAVAQLLAEEEEDEDETQAAETTEAPAETVPETTVPETTVPVTTAPPETVPPTTAAPVIIDTEPTQPPTETTQATQPTETTAPDENTAPADVVEQVGSRGWIGAVIVAGVLTLLLVGALIVRGKRHSGGKYRE